MGEGLSQLCPRATAEIPLTASNVDSQSTGLRPHGIRLGHARTPPLSSYRQLCFRREDVAVNGGGLSGHVGSRPSGSSPLELSDAAWLVVGADGASKYLLRLSELSADGAAPVGLRRCSGVRMLSSRESSVELQSGWNCEGNRRLMLGIVET